MTLTSVDNPPIHLDPPPKNIRTPRTSTRCHILQPVPLELQTYFPRRTSRQYREYYLAFHLHRFPRRAMVLSSLHRYGIPWRFHHSSNAQRHRRRAPK